MVMLRWVLLFAVLGSLSLPCSGQGPGGENHDKRTSTGPPDVGLSSSSELPDTLNETKTRLEEELRDHGRKRTELSSSLNDTLSEEAGLIDQLSIHCKSVDDAKRELDDAVDSVEQSITGKPKLLEEKSAAEVKIGNTNETIREIDANITVLSMNSAEEEKCLNKTEERIAKLTRELDKLKTKRLPKLTIEIANATQCMDDIDRQLKEQANAITTTTKGRQVGPTTNSPSKSALTKKSGKNKVPKATSEPNLSQIRNNCSDRKVLLQEQKTNATNRIDVIGAENSRLRKKSATFRKKIQHLDADINELNENREEEINQLTNELESLTEINSNLANLETKRQENLNSENDKRHMLQIHELAYNSTSKGLEDVRKRIEEIRATLNITEADWNRVSAELIDVKRQIKEIEDAKRITTTSMPEEGSSGGRGFLDDVGDFFTVTIPNFFLHNGTFGYAMLGIAVVVVIIALALIFAFCKREKIKAWCNRRKQEKLKNKNNKALKKKAKKDKKEGKEVESKKEVKAVGDADCEDIVDAELNNTKNVYNLYNFAYVKDVDDTTVFTNAPASCLAEFNLKDAPPKEILFSSRYFYSLIPKCSVLFSANMHDLRVLQELDMDRVSVPLTWKKLMEMAMKETQVLRDPSPSPMYIEMNRKLFVALANNKTYYMEEKNKKIVEYDVLIELLNIAHEKMSKMKSLVNVDGPTFVIPSLLGNVPSLVRILAACGNDTANRICMYNIVLNGSLIDGIDPLGSVYTLLYFLSLIAIAPKPIVWLRGKMEVLSESIKEELQKEYGVEGGNNANKKLMDIYNSLPLMAKCGKHLAVPGGPPKDKITAEDISKIQRPIANPSEHKIASGTVYSKPALLSSKTQEPLVGNATYYSEEEAMHLCKVTECSAMIIGMGTSPIGYKMAGVNPPVLSVSAKSGAVRNEPSGIVFIDEFQQGRVLVLKGPAHPQEKCCGIFSRDEEEPKKVDTDTSKESSGHV